jgi:hypothetical protein
VEDESAEFEKITEISSVIARGATFYEPSDEASGDRSESTNLVPR